MPLPRVWFPRSRQEAGGSGLLPPVHGKRLQSFTSPSTQPEEALGRGLGGWIPKKYEALVEVVG